MKEKNIDFTIGRDDFGATVYVPWNCTNNCPFCNSKKDYEIIKSDYEAVKSTLKNLKNSLVEVITFTGGEPTADIPKLKELVSIISNKIVFINTTLPNKNCNEFIKFVNSTKCIKGISISRHCESFEEDCKFLFNIAPDEVMAKIKKPVRINVVETTKNSFSDKNVENLIKRWQPICELKQGDLILNLRSDYTKQKIDKIHDLEHNNIVNMLAKKYFYTNHSLCNVCDTCVFLKKLQNKTMEIHYHRGLATTSLSFGNIIEINDLIILQNGEMCYDWDGKNKQINNLKKLIEIKENKND